MTESMENIEQEQNREELFMEKNYERLSAWLERDWYDIDNVWVEEIADNRFLI